MSLLDETERVVDGISVLRAPERGRFPHCNSLVIGRSGELLIDAGFGLDRRLEPNGWRPERVVVSHSHPDHVASLAAFSDSELWSPVQRSETFWRYEPLGRRFGGEEFGGLWVDLIRRIGVQEVSADCHFDDGHVFEAGGVRLHCMHAPGHVDDHYVFFEPHHGVAITCDIDLSRFGPWYGQPEGDPDLFLESIAKVEALQPKVIVSSHKGIMKDDIPGRLRRYADVIRQRDELLLSLLGAPVTVERLVDANPFFEGRPEPAPLFRFWEGNMIRKHLGRLVRRGAAVQDPDGRWRRI
jgi:glyoxylase-like metal-dependent hydrolase (beta-lactamase superfamily II)